LIINSAPFSSSSKQNQVQEQKQRRDFPARTKTKTIPLFLGNPRFVFSYKKDFVGRLTHSQGATKGSLFYKLSRNRYSKPKQFLRQKRRRVFPARTRTKTILLFFGKTPICFSYAKDIVSR